MRAGVWLVVGFGFWPLLGQDCAPTARLLPTGNLSAALDNSNCSLTDGTGYAPYRLDLPARGQIQIDLGGTAADLILILRDSNGTRLDSGVSIHRPIEAGSYTVLVNGRVPGQAGPYSVQTAYTAEPGMLCSAFPNIGLNQTVAGVLPSTGCTAPDGSAYEAYTLSAQGAGNLNVTLASSDFTPAVLLRGSDGSALGPSGASLNVALSADSQYVIVVSSADKTGAYQLTTAFTPADGESCLATRTLTDSANDTAAITVSSCYVTIPGSGDQSYYNFYNLTVASPGQVDISATSGDFTHSLYLLDQAGNELASDTGAGGNDPALGVTSGVRMQLNPGNYSVQLFSDVPSGGQYSLQYVFTPRAPQPCASVAANPGDAPAGNLSLTSCRTSLGWADLYSMRLPAAGSLSLDLSSQAFDTVLAIRDAKDNLVVQTGAANGVTVSHIGADLPAGAYTIVAAADQGNGAYTLASRFDAHAIPACADAQPLDINGGYIQRLGPASCRDANGQPVDYYQFSLPSDGAVAAVMTSNELDGYLTLLDSSGNVLRTDDNSYGSNGPLIVQYLPAGSYKIAARAASSTIGGLYEVDLRTVMGPRPVFCAPKSTVALGDTVTGALSFSACQYPDSTFADIYQMNLTSDTTIDLRLNSTDFDAYLVLLDAKGNMVDQDDNGGGDTNARITTLLPAGAYYAVAKPFGDYTAHGSYTLTVAAAN